ncbi:uncharacterized protein LOC134787277, partial [Penaeus indicus]|uniref:uncharacterized protein LOC134787277 n=1 Tax=Penaeus indicus TaxID=29960 RepID=UPI00300D7065
MASPPSPPTSALYELTTKESKKVLRQVLEWGTPRKQEDKTFVEYLLQVKNISMSTFRKKFNQNQRKKMEKGNDSTAFDVSLLCVCIKYGCDGLASPEDDRWTNSGDTLEWYVTSIKNRRNAFLHEDYDINMNEFYRVTEELRDLFCNALKRAAEIYNVADGIVKDILGQLNEEINNIRDNPSQMPDGGSLIYDRLRQMVAIEGKRELKKAYRKVSGFGPVSNLLRGMEVRVDEIFTAMLVRQESTHGSTAQTEDIQFEDLLEAAERKRKDSRKDRVVLLVEGPAGAGKTTLTRKVISDWVKGTSSMRTLTDYDFVYLSRCRDGGIYSLSQLLASLMPTVRGKIQHEHSLLEYTWGNGSLFIVDGIDELNPASDRLLREIMKMGTENEITVLCTTRPNRVADFKKYVPDNFHLVHVKILGIEEKKRADFVTRYSEALPIQNKDISGLLRYLARNDSRMQSHWRFPFNLVLVTILWLSDPNAVNHLTTATELFKKTHDFCVQKLLERLFDHEDTRILENTELEQKIKKFLKKFCKEAFISHCGDNMVLSNSSVQRLKEASRFLSLPSKEVLGAFLIQTTPLADVEEEYSFPHKSLQDFYSALHVIEILAVHETGLNIPSLISGIETLL